MGVNKAFLSENEIEDDVRLFAFATWIDQSRWSTFIQ